MATTTNDERIARLEQGFENEQEWRREMINRMREMNAKINSNHKWTVGLLITILIAIVASNFVG